MKTESDNSVSSQPRTGRPRRARRRAACVASALALALAALLAVPMASAALPAAGDGAEAAPAPTRWHTRIAPALAEAEAKDKLVFVDLYADWCGWCKKLDVEFRTPHFRDFARDYVLLRVDVEDGGEGSELRSHLGVRALPTLALMDHRKVKVGLIQGFQPAPRLTSSIRRTVAQWRAERQEIERQIAEGGRQDRLAAADRLRAMYDGAAAAKVYRRVLAEDGLADDERARVGAALADALLMAGEATAASRAVSEARQALVGVQGVERTATERILDTLDLRITQQLGDCQQASALESFLRDHPSSTVAGHARKRLSELQSGPAADCS